jgi:hypothetical protein
MKNSSPIKKLSLIASGVALSTCVLAVDRANAQTILLDFEGLKDTEQILNFYNGGTGSLSSSGINYGVSFSPNSAILILMLEADFSTPTKNVITLIMTE